MAQQQKLNIERIWWRNVQPGEFYNIERVPRIAGGGGSLYIEIPSSLVERTLEFLDATGEDVENLPAITIEAGVIGQPGLSGPIEFQRKKGKRMRIANQNRQQSSTRRHPAWISDRGFPKAPDNVRSTEDAKMSFPEGGLRIYIAKTFEGEYYAGFTKGHRPSNLKPTDPMWDLYSQKGVGGVVNA